MTETSLCWLLSLLRQLSTFAAECWRLQHGASSAPVAINRYLLPAGHSAANVPVTCCCRSTGQTDSRMDDPFIGPVLHFVWAASSINGNCSTDWSADGARSNQVCRSEIASRHWVMSQLLLRRPVQMLQHSMRTVSAIWHLLYYGTEPVYLALFTRTLYRVGQKK